MEVARRWPDVPTLFTSGYAAELIEREALASGSIAFIAKPFASSELLEVVAAQSR